MSSTNKDLLMSLKEIADMAGVSHSAVWNWRKRKSVVRDFPQPRIETASGPLFDFQEVHEWLTLTQKINSSQTPTMPILVATNLLRSYMDSFSVTAFTVATLVYLEACKRSNEKGSSVKVTSSSTWESVSQVSLEKRFSALLKATQEIEQANSSMSGTMTNGIELGSRIPAETFDTFFNVCNSGWGESRAYGPLLKMIISRSSGQGSRFGYEHSTPQDLATILALIANGRGKRVFDPAVGTSNVFMRMLELGDVNKSHEFIGYGFNEASIAISKGMFFLLNQQAQFEVKDSLKDWDLESVHADVVILDPPFGESPSSTSEEVPANEWPFGNLRGNSRDFAWFQVAWKALRPGGIALVFTSQSPASRGGNEGRVRQAMLSGGAVASVVSLPGNVREIPAVPQILWVLCKRENAVEPRSLQLVDATTIGKPGRRGRELHQFEDEELNALAQVVSGHMTGNDVRTGVAITQKLIDPAQLVEGNILQAIKEMNQPAMEDVNTLKGKTARLAADLDASLKAANTAVTKLLVLLKDLP